MPRVTQQEKEQAIEYLTESLQPGDTVHLMCRHVSRSGMRRAIRPLVIRPDPTDPTGRRVHTLSIGWNVARALGWRYSREYEAVLVDGFGMNTGFHLVHELSGVLFHSTDALTHQWL